MVIINTKLENIVIYHKNCLDGVSSLWVCEKYYNDNNLTIKLSLGCNPQCNELFKLLTNNNINYKEESYNYIFVDICPNKEILTLLHNNMSIHSELLILDHHESNELIINNFVNNINNTLSSINESHVTNESQVINESQVTNKSQVMNESQVVNKSQVVNESQVVKKNTSFIFDMKLSGCQITWDYYFSKVARPWFIDYIGDGDLWKWELNNSKVINSILGDKFKSVDGFNTLYNNFKNIEDDKFKLLLNEYKIIENYKITKIANYVKYAKQCIFKINNISYNIWLSLCNDMELISGLGNELTKKQIYLNDININNIDINNINKTITSDKYPDFVIIIKNMNLFKDNKHKYGLSLRSNSEFKPNVNVSVISSLLGGGGHKNAAGMELEVSKFNEYFIFE